MSQERVQREVVSVVTAHRQREGAGFTVRRPFPSATIEQADPFLLIDEMGPTDYRPGEAIGAPDHPHRGFETVTYVLEGAFEHEDSAGHRGRIAAGGVQWMTAGAGLIHSEEPADRIKREGGRIHGFQIWVNLPRALKMTQPRYQEVSADGIPTGRSADGLASVRVIAGRALGAEAVIDTHLPITFQDWTLQAGADVTAEVDEGLNALVYVFEGSVRVGAGGMRIAEGQMAQLGDGGLLRLQGDEGTARFLLLAGKPLNEPLARYGPFVMNTRDELLEAMDDFRSGRMGEITRTAQVVDVPAPR